jgi:hypothetical protein
VDGAVGCCDPHGVVHFCLGTSTVYDVTCSGTDVCGWSATYGFYDCVAPPSTSDPSGMYPIDCMP